ncbi:MAG: hypothetical protein LCH30_06210 [Proteobacteria bacterium]|nr:hypothetical protein [Pseudomonadota bacterium]
MGIFDSEEDRVSNLIDATSNKGVARSTLEGLYHTLSNCTKTGNLFGIFDNKLEVSVVRSKKLSGQKIAEQAEFWRLCGLSYDVGSLANIVETTWSPLATHSNEEINTNINRYWNYAKRSHTVLIENPTPPGTLIVICSFFLTPIWNLPKSFVNLFVNLIHYLSDDSNEKKESMPVNKGVNCAGFVLSTLAAVALKDETKSAFDIEKCKEKLGPIATINPDNYSLNEIMANVFNNAEFFEDLGVLDTKNLSRKSFDKESYREEQRQDAIATEGLKTF